MKSKHFTIIFLILIVIGFAYECGYKSALQRAGCKCSDWELERGDPYLGTDDYQRCVEWKCPND